MTRFGYVMVTHFSVVTFTALNFVSVTPRLIWNASASIPVGLYRLHKIDAPDVGDLVAVAPPEPIARYLADRNYLPRKVPLLKYVAAFSGQTICRTGTVIAIDGKDIATALEYDRLGRDLPTWSGCHRLAGGEVFLLNADVPDSLDGRYFGVLSAEAILGAMTPIWTRDGGLSAVQAADHGH
ncbi:MAG: family signal peptidase [Proteobacteria bacterium]|nr:family signal peptidase [Pseudomonadota bacterium]